MKLFVNLKDTTLHTHYNQILHCMTIEFRTFPKKEKFVIEIFGISSSKRENLILDNYELTKMDDHYIAFEPCSLVKDDAWKVTLLLLPTVSAESTEKVLIPVPSEKGSNTSFSLGIDYDCSKAVGEKKYERHVYLTTIKFEDLARADVVFASTNRSVNEKHSIFFDKKYKFRVKRTLYGVNFVNTVEFEKANNPESDDLGKNYYKMNEITRKIPKPVFIRA